MRSFLLISDIHATSADPGSWNSPSYVSSYSSSSSGRKDPISDLYRIVKEEDAYFDYVLCAGDIADRSNPNSMTYVWERLNKLASDFEKPLIATVGNHDLDSRYKENKWDPRGYVMSLEPRIPYNNRQKYLEYWAENFSIITDDHVNIVSLNTAAYHGGGENASAELEHGRVSDATLSKLASSLSNIDNRPINILLCHHHLIKGDQGDVQLAGQTRGGEKLVQALEATGKPWVIIHGHKHVPDLFYGHGGANSPIVLGCASFSAQVNTDAQNKSPNQVHLLRCDPDAADSLGLDLAGEVLSWTWQPGVGWKRSQGDAGLPHEAGFGYRGSVRVLAAQLDAAVAQADVPHMSWREAITKVPLLARVLPTDFVSLERELGSRNMALLRERNGGPAQIGRSVE
jgi:predicted MPP superfamily phosphohydrolase